MAIIKNHSGSDLILTENTQLYGTINGSVTVRANISCHIHGTILGNLTIEKGSDVVLHGTVEGNTRNMGGKLVIYGAVNGKLISDAGQTEVKPQARIKR